MMTNDHFTQQAQPKFSFERLIGQVLDGISTHEIWKNKLTTHGMRIRQGGLTAPPGRDKNGVSTNFHKPKIWSQKKEKNNC